MYFAPKSVLALSDTKPFNPPFSETYYKRTEGRRKVRLGWASSPGRKRNSATGMKVRYRVKKGMKFLVKKGMKSLDQFGFRIRRAGGEQVTRSQRDQEMERTECSGTYVSPAP